MNMYGILLIAILVFIAAIVVIILLVKPFLALLRHSAPDATEIIPAGFVLLIASIMGFTTLAAITLTETGSALSLIGTLLFAVLMVAGVRLIWHVDQHGN